MEVNRQIETASNKDRCVTEIDHKHSKVVPVTENAWRARKLPFIQAKNDCGDDAEYDKADHGGRGPGVLGAAELEAQEEHQCSTDNQNETDPVDCAETFEDAFETNVDFEEEEKTEEGEAANWYC